MRGNVIYSEAVSQQVRQFLEEQETLVVVSVDVLWSTDGQLNDVPGSKVDFCIHSSVEYLVIKCASWNTNGCCPVRHIQLLRGDLDMSMSNFVQHSGSSDCF